eukprot:GHVU01000312.1.p1 GENE.GHVU01000312.1~~GHVU01000312.1.p1  ORF type:complete len:379 (-),score=16.10 GHVU01000312.1:181-1317(-)
MVQQSQSWRAVLGASAGDVSGTAPTSHRAALAPQLGLPDERSTPPRRGPTSTVRRLQRQVQGFTNAFDVATGRTPSASVLSVPESAAASRLRHTRPPPATPGRGDRPIPPSGNLVDRLLDEIVEEEEERWRVEGDLVGDGGVPLHNTQAMSPSDVYHNIRREELDPTVSPGRAAAALSSRRGPHSPPSARSPRDIVPLPSPLSTLPAPGSSCPAVNSTSSSFAHPCARLLPPGAGVATTTRDVVNCYQSKTLETKVKAVFCLHSVHFRQVANTQYPSLHRFDAKRGELTGRHIAAAARKLVCAVFNIKKNTLNSWITSPAGIATWLASTERLTLGQAVGGVRDTWRHLFASWNETQNQERVRPQSAISLHLFTNSFSD